MIKHTPKFIRKLYPPEVLWEIPNSDRKVFLTFDDGPVKGITPKVLSILEQYKAKASFFMVGENVSHNPSLMQEVLSEGHAVGNHSFNHLKGWKTDENDYIKNVEKASAFIPGNLFRPPYGKMTIKQARLLNPHYQIVMWSILSEDYNTKLSWQNVYQTVKNHVRPGSIIVFHDSQKAQKNMIPALQMTLDYLSSNGYKTDVIHS